MGNLLYIPRHHVFADGSRVSVLAGYPGCRQAQGAGLPGFQHADRRLLCGSAAGSARAFWGARDIQHRPQGSQFTSEDWLEVLKVTGCRISMDGKGRWIDNVFIERLWRSIKYEEVYLHAYRDGREARRRLQAYFETYNSRRLHQSADYCTPDEVYFGIGPLQLARAA